LLRKRLWGLKKFGEIIIAKEEVMGIKEVWGNIFTSKFKDKIKAEIRSTRFRWITTLLIVLGLLNACGDGGFSPQSCNGDASCSDQTSSSSTAGGSSSSGGSSSGSTFSTGSNRAPGSGGLVTSTFGGSGGGMSGTSATNTSGGSGSPSSSGGAGIVTSSGGSSPSQPSSYSFETPLTIVGQPMDVNLQEGDVFSLSFIAIGKAPLTYTWYKKGTTDSNLGGGVNHTIYYNTKAKKSDGGIYYATVIDGNNKKLLSREVRVNVKEGRHPCAAGYWAPRKVQNGGFNHLYPRSQIYPGGGAPITKQIGEVKDSYIITMSCDLKRISSNNCNSGKWLTNANLGRVLHYQCQNGHYELVNDLCLCYVHQDPVPDEPVMHAYDRGSNG